jgi:flagellar hook-associated protein 2
MALSLDGLSTGLDSAGLIKSLMAAEAGAQNSLKAKARVATTAAAAYRSINTRFDALRTAAEALSKPAAFTAAKATVTGTGATAVATTGALPGQLSFSVTQLATTRSIISGTTTTAPTDIVAGPVSATRGGVTYAFGTDMSMADLAATINADAVAGLQAAVVKTGTDTYKLMVSAKGPGLAGDFTLDGLGVASGEVAAQDAVISLAGVPITSATNTFADLVPGVSVTVTEATDVGEPPTVVNIAVDTDAVVASVKAVVEAANAALTEIDKQSAAAVTGSGPLRGDSMLRQLRDRVLSVVSSAVDADGAGAGAAKDANDLGLQLTRTGQLAFDEAKFKTAFTADPAAVQAALSGLPPATDPVTKIDEYSSTDPGVGFAQRLLGTATLATRSSVGLLTVAAQGRDNSIKDLEIRIEDWDRRLAVRESAYQRQFANLEVMIGKMNQQSAWLASQLSSLPTA